MGPHCYRMLVNGVSPTGREPNPSLPPEGPVKGGRKPSWTVEALRETAAALGGSLLSGTVGRSQDKVRWRCADGHEWEASPKSVFHEGKWCPRCRKKKAAPGDGQDADGTQGPSA